jgi:cold shock CspA family protein
LNVRLHRSGDIDLLYGDYSFTSIDGADEVFLHLADVGGPDLEAGQATGFDVEQSPMSPGTTTVFGN